MSCHTGTEQVNADVASMVAAEFAVQSTLYGVAQAVVDRIVRIHQDTWYTGSERANHCQKRDDMTLLVRNFNYPLPNALNSPVGQSYFSTNPFTSGSSSYGTESEMPGYSTVPATVTSTQTYDSTESSGGGGGSGYFRSQESGSILPLDEQGKIKPYVSFDEFFKAVSEAELQAQVDAMGGEHIESEQEQTPDTTLETVAETENSSECEKPEEESVV